MKTVLDPEMAEQILIDIVKKICDPQGIDEVVTGEFCPGKYIMSQVLVSIIPEIEISLGITIPIDCYIFHDNNKQKEQLTIKGAVKKLIKIAKS